MARPPEPIEHGTKAGYLKHRRRNIPHSECQDRCLQAWNRYAREARQKGKTP